MKKLSKFIAVALTVLLSLSIFAMCCSAASVNYSVTSASGTKGSNVTVSVKLSAGVELWGSSVTLRYNSAELQYVSSSKGNLVSTGSLNHANSAVSFAGALNQTAAKSGGTVFTVTFKILKDSGSSALSLAAGGGKDNCDYDGNAVAATASGGSVSVTIPVNSVALNTNNVSLEKGGTAQLTATVNPGNATNRTVKYTSSNTKVAKVDGGGKITAVGGGTATITATADGKSATCKVTVTVKQTGIARSGSQEKTVSLGKTLKLKVAKVPADATDNYAIKWTSSNEAVATVSANGTVTGVSLGEAEITATSNGWTVKYKITVAEAPTEESSTDESSTEITETETQTETAVTEITTEATTAPTEAKGIKRLFRIFIDKIYDTKNTVSKFYAIVMMCTVGIITASVTIPVTSLVAYNYGKYRYNRNNGNNEDEHSEK